MTATLHFATEEDEEITFTIGSDPFVFRATPPSQMPFGALLKVAKGAKGAASDDEDAGLDAVDNTMDFLDMVLLPESAEKFAERLQTPGPSAITSKHVGEIVKALMERYSGNPTDEPSPSPAGQAANGTPSAVSSDSKESTTS